MRFALSRKFVVDSEKEPWNTEGLRICFFGGSGSGKSWTAALFIEQWLSQKGTVVIFQPRDEYFTLKERFDVLCVGGVHAKDLEFIPVKPSAYAKAIVQDGVSVIFYTSDVEEEKLIGFVQKLLNHIMKYNEKTKRPILIVLEEAQEFCPLSTRGRAVAPWIYAKMIKAFKDLFLQGRKLNISTIALSPRPQEVNFTVRQLANLTFYGKFSPQDISYVDRECLKPYRERGVAVDSLRLLDLKVGSWLVIYGANAEFIRITQRRLTSHGAVTPKLKYEVPKKEGTKKTLKELTETLQKIIEKEKLEKSETEKLKRRITELTKIVETQKEEISRLKTALEIASKLEIKQSKANVDLEKIKAEIVSDLRLKVMSVFDSYGVRPISTEKTKLETEVLREVWLPKLKTRAAKKILEFLLDHTKMKYTRGEIARFLGYSRNSGTFYSGISELKRNGLVRCEGKYLWVEA